MEKVKETLDRLYQACINVQTHWRFFLGLFDYAEFIGETPILKQISGKTFKKSEKELTELKKLEKVCLSELEKSIKKIHSLISKNKISSGLLKKPFEELERDQGEETLSRYSPSPVENIHCSLARIVLTLYYELGYRKLVIRNFVNESESQIDNTEPCINKTQPCDDSFKFTFSKSYDNFVKKIEAFKDQSRLDISNDWGQIVMVYDFITSIQTRIDESKREIIKYSGQSVSHKFFTDLGYELDYIEKCANITDDDINFFKRYKYQPCLDRTHSYFLKELAKIEGEKGKNKELIKAKENKKSIIKRKIIDPTDIKFDEDKGVLQIGKAIIKLQKFKNQYYLTKIIFQDSESMQKEWFYDEIQEEIEGTESSESEKLYDVAYALRQKIAIETGIKDFLILTNQSVKINSDYL